MRPVKEEGFRLLKDGMKTIQDVDERRMALSFLGGTAPHPTEGRRLVLSDPQLYVGTSYVERLFFSMFKFHNIRVWKSGYHFSPGLYPRSWMGGDATGFD